ncbi:RNA polymerase II holoenzyme cyclin-like subunit, putative [Candida dubliniensis CD36]|uniref:RNA polymerase II holoenzyme cyclin-like subunit n=1 Tax=Candida dubliniensis (strain CD36 / ATCC MYA-646 / CBS 7987 / NCPF 3949 / NRRL Y-17841) TaxID=573826 RepID=B9WEF5_CANDC|nr:RNA polymerase II holoenzyme cyclin-like subunit, putative [Candida dubliniensis CD36]CAX43067.1 RNA polymerase II holoenzyme cyclin-like subunit, putative [Candida dubliniensis CD36]
MSADYWNSSQRNQWQLTRFSLLESRRRVLLLERKMIQNGLIKDYPNIIYDYNMRIYLHNLLIKLGRRLNIRQIALATAEIYLTRFLTRVSLKEINVYLLITTCIYVACKIEECPQHIRLILSEARNIWPEYIPHDVTKLAEFEFYLIEEMDSYLLLHHPYKSLIQINDFLSNNYNIYGFKLTVEELQNAWSLINDSYITDLHLLLPPHTIAVAAIYITVVLKKNLSRVRQGNSNDNTMHISTGSSTNPIINNTTTTSANITHNNNNNNNTNNNNGTAATATTTNEGQVPGQDDNTEMNIDDLMNLTKSSNTSQDKSDDKMDIDNPSQSQINLSQYQIQTQNHQQSTHNNTNSSNTNTPNTQIPQSQPNQELNNFDLDILDENTIKINKFMNFLEHSHINLDEVVEAVQDMMNMYVLWNRYNEQGVKKALQVMLLNRI